MTTSTDDVAEGLVFVAHAFQRGVIAEHAVTVLRQDIPVPHPDRVFGVLLAALGDVPRLVELAKTGLLDRALIQQHAGHQERAERVRDLHACLELPVSRLICRHCRAEFPCPTLVALDG